MGLIRATATSYRDSGSYLQPEAIYRAMVQRSYTCYTVEESTLRQSKRTSAPLHLISSLLGSYHTKKTGFQSVKSLCTLVFSKWLTMAQLFFCYWKPSNLAAFGKWQKHKSKLSSKSTKMRSCDTKNAKKCIFRYNAVSESQCLCGVDDDLNDNLFLYGADKLKRLYQIKRINF